jgi:tetratricopeptide (TPR) repeat protein
LGTLRSDDLPRALGLSIHANAHLFGQGNFAEAITLYEQAASLYAALDRRGDQARVQIGKVYALAQLGHYREAEETVAWARPLLEENEDWAGLSRMVSNLGILYSRMGEEARALAIYDQARAYCLRSDSTRHSFLPNIELNRALALRYLGRFDESIATSQHARAMLLESNSNVFCFRPLQRGAFTSRSRRTRVSSQ